MGGDDEDTGICSAPACGGGIYVSPDSGRKPTSQGLLLSSRATRLSGMHLTVPPADNIIVMACS